MSQIGDCGSGKGGKGQSSELTRPTEPPFVSFVSEPLNHFTEKFRMEQRTSEKRHRSRLHRRQAGVGDYLPDSMIDVMTLVGVGVDPSAGGQDVVTLERLRCWSIERYAESMNHAPPQLATKAAAVISRSACCRPRWTDRSRSALACRSRRQVQPATHLLAVPCPSLEICDEFGCHRRDHASSGHIHHLQRHTHLNITVQRRKRCGPSTRRWLSLHR